MGISSSEWRREVKNKIVRLLAINDLVRPVFLVGIFHIFRHKTDIYAKEKEEK